jgi:outer membrane receptor protein involved in Fe transport
MLVFNPGPEIVVTELWQNALKGDTRGMEFSATWNPLRRWRLQAGYAREDAVLGALRGDMPSGGTPERYWRTPRNTLDVRSGWDLRRRWSIDSTFSWVSRIPSSTVPHYTRVDLHIARRIGEGGEISAGVRNLLDREHLEFISEESTVSSMVRRDAYVKVMWRF